jgi:hypothetical protein
MKKQKKQRKAYRLNGQHCRECDILLTPDNVQMSDVRQANYICKSCRHVRSQIRYQNNREKIRKQQKGYVQALKLKVMEAYGGKCACCGEMEIGFLTIDHVNSDGAELRKTTKQGTGEKMYRWLIKNNLPKDDYQVLCFNCNLGRALHGSCPHTKTSR